MGQLWLPQSLTVLSIVLPQGLHPFGSWSGCRILGTGCRFRHWNRRRCWCPWYCPAASPVRRNDPDPYLRWGVGSVRSDRRHLPVHEISYSRLFPSSLGTPHRLFCGQWRGGGVPIVPVTCTLGVCVALVKGMDRGDRRRMEKEFTWGGERVHARRNTYSFHVSWGMAERMRVGGARRSGSLNKRSWRWQQRQQQQQTKEARWQKNLKVRTSIYCHGVV